MRSYSYRATTIRYPPNWEYTESTTSVERYLLGGLRYITAKPFPPLVQLYDSSTMYFPLSNRVPVVERGIR